MILSGSACAHTSNGYSIFHIGANVNNNLSLLCGISPNLYVGAPLGNAPHIPKYIILPDGANDADSGRRISMKNKLTALLTAAALAACPMCMLACNNDMTTVRLSEVTHSIFYAPLYVAINNGYFADEKKIVIDG